MCTLLLPCAHFFREDSLRKYLKREVSKDSDRQKAMGSKKLVNSLGMKKIDHGSVVLMEAGLNNRDSDRSEEVFHVYHKRELELEHTAKLLEDSRAAKVIAFFSSRND